MPYIVAFIFPDDPLNKVLKELEKYEYTVKIINASFFFPRVLQDDIKICDIVVTSSVIYPQFPLNERTLVVCNESPSWLRPDTNVLLSVSDEKILSKFSRPVYYTPLNSEQWKSVLDDIYFQIKERTATPLCYTMAKYGSDKSPLYFKTRHDYTRLYNRLLTPLKDATRIFELGIGTTNKHFPSNMGKDGTLGASLYGWAEFFSKATIYGADIDKEVLFTTDRIKTYYCDQTNPDVINDMWKKEELKDGFDVMIDDGYHAFLSNLSFFENSIHKLNPNGYYIIEDIQPGDIEKMERQIVFWKDTYPTLDIQLHKRAYNHQPDNNVVVIHNKTPKYTSEISAYYYINLTHRTDRKRHILEQFRLASIPEGKIQRINASYKPTFGLLGCVESHIYTLEMALEAGHEYVAVFEDDFTFNRPSKFMNQVKQVLINYKPNIIHLAYLDPIKEPTFIPGLCKIKSTATTSGYIIHRSYIPLVLANF